MNLCELCPLSWHGVVRGLNLAGMHGQLASSCDLEWADQNGFIYLALRDDLQHLASERFIARLSEELQSFYGCKIEVSVRLRSETGKAFLPLPETWNPDDARAVDEIYSSDSKHFH